jgi:hypothetical protein
MWFVETKVATSLHHMVRHTFCDASPERNQFSEAVCKGDNSGTLVISEEKTISQVGCTYRHSPRVNSQT